MAQGRGHGDLIRFVHSLADMTLVTSNVILNEFKQEKIAAEEKMSVWRKAVDTDIFNPCHRCEKTRAELCGANPGKRKGEAPRHLPCLCGGWPGEGGPAAAV